LNEGHVSRDDVLQVLKDNSVSVTKDESGEHPSGMYILEYDGNIECMELPEYCGRRLLHTFARKYNIPIHFFYNVDLSKSKRPNVQ